MPHTYCLRVVGLAGARVEHRGAAARLVLARMVQTMLSVWQRRGVGRGPDAWCQFFFYRASVLSKQNLSVSAWIGVSVGVS